MGGGEEFREFSRMFAPALVRTAYLLTGDPAAADRVAVEALARTRRRWRVATDLDVPERFTLRTLVRLCRRSATHRTAGSGDVTVVRSPEEPVDPDAARRDELWAALALLNPRERAVVVLDHLPESSSLRLDVDTADALGMRHGRLVELTASATRRLESAGFESLTVNGLLRDTLAERAAALVAPFDPATQVRNEVVRSRRVAGAVAAAVALVMAGGVVVGVAHQRGHGAPQASASGTPTATPSMTRSAALRMVTPPLSWPTRGNLADDAAVIAALRVRFVTDNPSIIGGVEVLCAADIAGARVALLAGRRSGSPDTSDVFSWYVGNAGDAVTALQAPDTQDFSYFEHPERQPITFGLPDGRTMLIVLAPPAASSIEVSWRPTYPPDGTVTRFFESLPAQQGLVVVDVSARPRQVIRLRVTGPTGGYFDGPIIQMGTVHQMDFDAVPQADLQAAWGKADPVTVALGLYDLAQTLGVDTVAQLHPRVVWGGTVDGREMAIIRARLDGGGEFQVVYSSGSAMTAVSVLPSGAPDLPAMWVSWDVQTGKWTYDVLARSGVARAELRVRDQVIDSVPVSVGVVARLADREDPLSRADAVVNLLSASGQIVLSRPALSLGSDDIAGLWTGINASR